jgi:ribosome maturation factor RimP
MSGVTRNTLVERVQELANRACGREGIEVWEVEVLGSGRNRVVRVYIDKPEGVSHADCELVSQQLGTLLDVEDVITGSSYQLEVSSPGVERKLRGVADFRRYTGEKARIALREPLDNQRRFEGLIQSVEGEEIVFEATTGKTIRVRMEQIDKANLKFDW